MSSKHLVEEDQDASDDEDEKRISFSGVKNKTQRQKIAEEIGTVVEWVSVWPGAQRWNMNSCSPPCRNRRQR